MAWKNSIQPNSAAVRDVEPHGLRAVDPADEPVVAGGGEGQGLDVRRIGECKLPPQEHRAGCMTNLLR